MDIVKMSMEHIEACTDLFIEREIQAEEMNAVILNTERGFPSEQFYLKNGFKVVDGLITLIK